MGNLESQQPLLDLLPGIPPESTLPHAAIVGAIKVL